MSTTIEIFTDYILPNPWQPRERLDGEHIKQLALSIAREGLMQPPVGRWVFPDGRPVHGMGSADLTGSGLRVQLAFGHNRLAAFRWLEDVKNNSNLEGDWSRMPVTIVEMGNDEMFRRAVAENMARQELDPIEVARAMLRYREEFGKTSAEIGELFGLSDSAVRNKIRLLSLPESLQEALRNGEITEGTGRALIGLFDIPEAARAEAEEGEGLRPSVILEAARSGVAPAKIAEMVASLAGRLVPAAGQISVFDLASTVSIETLEAVEAAETPTVEDAPAWMEEESAEEPEDEPEPVDESDEEEFLEEKPDPRVVEPAQRVTVEAVAGTVSQIVTREPAPEKVAVKAQEPVPTPVPAKAAAPVAQAPVQVQAVQVAAAEPEKPVTWEGSTVLLSLTLWPEDSHGGRMVSIGGRLNQGSPRMTMASLADLNLPWQLHEMLESLKGGLK